MASYAICGNEYDKSFTITSAGQQHVFDSCECAIHAMAPTCRHCGSRILGHGVEADGVLYCCANCARHAGVAAVRDDA